MSHPSSRHGPRTPAWPTRFPSRAFVGTVRKEKDSSFPGGTKMIGDRPRVRGAHLAGILEEMLNEANGGKAELREMVTNQVHLSCFFSFFLSPFLFLPFFPYFFLSVSQL